MRTPVEKDRAANVSGHFLAAVAVAIAVAGGCATTKSESAPPADNMQASDPDESKAFPPLVASSGPDPIALVGGEKIARLELDRPLHRALVKAKRAGAALSLEEKRKLVQFVVVNLVEDKLMAQRAKAQSVAVSSDDVEKNLQQLKDRVGGEEAFAAGLKKNGRTVVDARSELYRDLLREALVLAAVNQTKASDVELKAYFDEHYVSSGGRGKKRGRGSPDEVVASQILIRVDAQATLAKRIKARAKANRVLKLAHKKGADFASLAGEHSEGPGKENGGDLGRFAQGHMVEALDQAVFKAKVGQVVGPVSTPAGFHIVKVREKFAGKRVRFDDVKEEVRLTLEQEMRAKVARDFSAQLRVGAEIEIFEPGVVLPLAGERTDEQGADDVIPALEDASVSPGTE